MTTEWKPAQSWHWQRYCITQHFEQVPTVGASIDVPSYLAHYELARWTSARPQAQLVQLGVFNTLDKAQRACEKHAEAVRRAHGPANDNGQLETRQAK